MTRIERLLYRLFGSVSDAEAREECRRKDIQKRDRETKEATIRMQHAKRHIDNAMAELNESHARLSAVVESAVRQNRLEQPPDVTSA